MTWLTAGHYLERRYSSRTRHGPNDIYFTSTRIVGRGGWCRRKRADPVDRCLSASVAPAVRGRPSGTLSILLVALASTLAALSACPTFSVGPSVRPSLSPSPPGRRAASKVTHARRAENSRHSSRFVTLPPRVAAAAGGCAPKDACRWSEITSVGRRSSSSSLMSAPKQESALLR